MKNTTIALLQAIFALIVIITNASLQTDALIKISRSTTTNVEIEQAKKLLLISIILQFVAALIMITVSIVLIVNRDKLQEHMNKLIYFALISSGLILLIGGSLGANVAVRLQCYRGDANVNIAWEKSSYSAVIGIVGTILLLVIQILARKDSIKTAAIDYLNIAPAVAQAPANVNVPMYAKAPMPTYHPPQYKRMFEE